MANEPRRTQGGNVHIGQTQPTINPAGQPKVTSNEKGAWRRDV